MKKIPTLFERDPENRRFVLPVVTPGCEWVLEGEGRATRKYDGTCTMLDEHGEWWARREIKPGGAEPVGYVAVFFDENTGKTMGWEPLESTGWVKSHREAIESVAVPPTEPGTYELIGPKVNGNPEGATSHVLVPHGKLDLPATPRDFEGLRALFTSDQWHAEGIVWWHPDGRMAKLKARDFQAVE